MSFPRNIHLVLSICFALHAVGSKAQDIRDNEVFAADLNEASSFAQSIGMNASLEEEGVYVSFPESSQGLFIRQAPSDEMVAEISQTIAQTPDDLAYFFDASKAAAAVPIYDISEILDILLEQNKPFLGPVVGVDGVFQLFIPFPGVGYIDFYTSKLPDQDHIEYVQIWEQVIDANTDNGPEGVLIKTPSLGTPLGEPFNSVDPDEPEDTIFVIQASWGTYIQTISLGYRSGRDVSYGYYHGPEEERVFLERGEVIVDGFICEQSASVQGDKLISYMSLVTSTGRQLHFGRITNQCLMFNIPKDHMIEGFYGHFDNYLHNLGAVFSPMEKI